jgi:copper chaperone NosL
VTIRSLLVSGFVALAACRGGPPSIAWNGDACDFCRMTISDRRYAAAATTATGRTVRFDAVECLAGWTITQPKPPRQIWVTDAERPGTLIAVDDARFFRASSGRSPMGKGFIAVAATTDSAMMAAKYGAGPFTWDQVRATIVREGAVPHTAPGGE